MAHTSRTQLLLQAGELDKIKSHVESKANQIGARKISVYRGEILKNNEGEISEKKKGNVNAFIWSITTKKNNNLSLNMNVINGYQDPLFNDEGTIKIYYEIFPSASSPQSNKNIYEDFEKIQNTAKASNYSTTIKTINNIFQMLNKAKNKN